MASESFIKEESEYEEEDPVTDEDAKRSLPLWTIPPWPVWNDSSINIEVWEANESQGLFEDPTGTILPSTINADKWIRPDLLLEPPKLVDWSMSTIDLINANIHICEISDLYRFMLSEISELYDYGLQNSFQLEGEGINFVPNSERLGASWKPWDHIYSCCKAGVKGDRPSLNQMGKYYVRLYYMGSWRRITVDDRIPLLADGSVGIPITGKTELWPMLLVKALLKIASLTWAYDKGVGVDKVHHFSTIEALTGWVHEWIDVPEPIGGANLWKELNDILPRYNGYVEPVMNYWTTGKTKKERDEDKLEEIRLNEDKPEELPIDLSSHWWTLLSLVDKQPEIEYVEYSSESDYSLAPKIVIDSDIPTSSFQTTNSVSEMTEMEAADEADESDVVELKKRQNEIAAGTRKGKKDKSKKSVKNKSRMSTVSNTTSMGVMSTAPDVKSPPPPPMSETEAADEAEDTDKESTKKDASAAISKTGKKDKGKKPKNKKKGSKEEAEVSGMGRKFEQGRERADSEADDATLISSLKPKSAKGKTAKDKKKRKSLHGGPRGSLTKKELETTEEEMTTEEEEETPATLKKDRKNRKVKHKSRTDFENQTSDQDVVPENKRISFAEEESEAEQEVTKPPKMKIPMMQEILVGVLKYLATENIPLISAWDSLCGKSIPDIITVVLSLYPPPEEHGTVVPSFLYHPMNLLEVRDTPLLKDPNRPVTPLWKTFRWKYWAMKKGLIPMESDPEQIRCVRAKTPFALKTDWYHSRLGVSHVEVFRKESPVDEGEYLVAYSHSGETIEESCGGGREEVLHEEEEDEEEEATTPPHTAPIRHPSAPMVEHPKATHSLSATHNKKASAVVSDKVIKKITHVQTSHGHKDHHKSKRLHGARHSSHNMKNKDKDHELETSSEEEIWFEEEEMNSAPLPTPMSEAGGFDTIPSTACGNIWFHCDNIAQYIRKICKVYSTRSLFGSCFVLRRTPDWGDSDYATISSTTGAQDEAMAFSNKEIVDFHAVPDSENLTIQFEAYKVLDIKNYHLDKTSGVDSAFYMFCDCWMDQEIILSLDVLQSSDVTTFAMYSNPMDYPDLLVEGNNQALNVGLIVEPWDWRRDCCMQKALVHCTTETKRSAHVTLRPGRNVFRIWIVENPDNPEAPISSDPYILAPYTIKIGSKTPIHVGSRDEVLKYMTNEPVLLLRQCDLIAHNIWAMFLLFGQSKAAYSQNFQSLRKSYCPSFPENNVINKQLKGVHFSFEKNFMLLIKELNGGEMDKMTVLAVQCLFLNPLLGKELPCVTLLPPPPPDAVESSQRRTSQDTQATQVEEIDTQLAAKVLQATSVIQRYCRGWFVRRLFHLRQKSHPKFPKIEFQMRKIAYLLARNTDSTFTRNPAAPTEVHDTQPDQEVSQHEEHAVEHERVEEEENAEHGPPENGHNLPESEQMPSSTTPPTLVPNPPKWTVKLFKGLLKEHPLLLAIHTFAYCLPQHIKIRETEGTLSAQVFSSNCAPFFRRVVNIVGDGNLCTCMIQLQITPPVGAVLRVINNETHTCLETPTTHMFLGQLKYNKMGYTILCYRLLEEASPTNDPNLLAEPPEAVEEMPAEDDPFPPVPRWKLQVVTSRLQDHFVFKEPHHHHRHQGHSSSSLNANLSSTTVSLATNIK